MNSEEFNKLLPWDLHRQHCIEELESQIGRELAAQEKRLFCIGFNFGAAWGLQNAQESIKKAMAQ